MRNRNPHRAASTAVAAIVMVAGAAPACAAVAVDTGTPAGGLGPYVFDATDRYAARLDFAAATDVRSIATHLLGTSAGETFTVALYGDAPAQLPGAPLFRAQASVPGDGWNGVRDLTGWSVAAGSYWIVFEIGADDTLGTGSVTGALLDAGVPNPIAHTAFDAGSGWTASASPLGFGVQVDAAALPEPATIVLLLAGLGGVGLVGRPRRAA